MSGWIVLDQGFGPVHLLPLEDAVEHEDKRSCPCSPQVTLQGRTCCDDRLYVREVVSHNAADGRE